MTNTAALKPLAINDVLDYDGQTVRLIAANPRANIVYLIEIGMPGGAKAPTVSKPALPFIGSYSQLRVNGVHKEDPHWDRPLNPTAAAQGIREARYARIKDLVGSLDVLSPKTRGPLLVAHAKKLGVSKKTLLEDLRVWWQRGQVKDALMGDYHRSGRVTASTPDAVEFKEKATNGFQTVFMAPTRAKARGRHPLKGNYTPMNLTAEERRQILKVGREKYEKDKTVTMTSVVAHVLNELYAAKGPDGKPLKDKNNRAVLPPMGSRPSWRQISYLLKTVLPVSRTFAKRNGTADFLNNFTGTTGTVFDDCNGPGDVYECDDTTLDFHVCSEVDRRIITGKPMFHYVVDRYTRLIVGFRVSLDSPTYQDSVLALLSTTQSWKSMCEKHGIVYDPLDFPAEGVVCNRIFSDRGPHMTFASDELSYVGNDTTNAPALLSRSKPIVESGFPRIQKYLKEVPGQEPQWNVQKRRRKPYEQDACLTLTELEGVLLAAIICANREELRDYPQSPDDHANGLKPVPRDLWPRAIERLNALPRRVSHEWMRQTLLSREMATVTQKGILFHDNYYTCKEIEQKDWLARAAINGNFEVEIRFTPKNLDGILVQDNHLKEVHYIAKLTTKSLQITGNEPGLTDTRSEAVQRSIREIRRDAKIHNEEVLVDFIQQVTPVVEAAYANMKALTKGASQASRKHSALELREAEAAALRKQDHRVSTLPAPDASAVAAPQPISEIATSMAPEVVVDDLLSTFTTPTIMDDFFQSLSNV